MNFPTTLLTLLLLLPTAGEAFANEARPIDSEACLLLTRPAGIAEKSISPHFGDLADKSPRLARIIRAGVLTRKPIADGGVFDQIRKTIASVEEWSTEQIVRKLNAGERDPTSLNAGSEELFVTGNARRTGGTLEVTIGKLRRTRLNWAENSAGPNTLVSQLFATVLDGIEANIRNSIARGKPLDKVVIRAGAVANQTLEKMFLSFDFQYDPKMVAAIEKRRRHPVYGRMDRLNAWIDRRIFRTEPDPNQGSNLDLILEFSPAK